MSRRSERDERGATAVLVAVLAVVLIGISGFTIDLGAAYVSKRNLQKASDAGALAAAQVLTKYTGACPTVRDNPLAFQEAHAAAQRFGELNYDGTKAAGEYDSTELEFDIDCDRTPGVLIVSYGLSGDTDTSTSRLLEAPDSITTRRRSEATVDVAPGVNEGMRPLALCSSSFDPAYSDRSGDFIRVHFPGAGRVPPESCDVDISGNWWLTDCPGERTGAAGGSNGLAHQILHGCPDPVSVVPGQADATTPGQLTVVLEDACPEAEQYSETCMSGNPGNITQGQTVAAWQEFMNSGEYGIFPVFCAPTSCSAVTAGGNGTNAVFPVYKLVSAYMCGFHFDGRNKYDSPHENCAGNPFPTSGDTTSNNYFVFRVINYRTSTSNKKSDCALGADCDGGLRRTRLTGGGE